MTPAANTTDRTTCFVNDWPVFVHGTHKGDLYPKADNARMVENFAMLSDADTATIRKEDGSPFLPVKAKIGHSRKQSFAKRLAGSFGFINVGKVNKERLGDNGTVRINIGDLPVPIGAAVNAGYIDSGSIECKPSIPDPRDAGKKIEGPVMFAISLLGEEAPAVPGLNSPKATFADGTPVPPMTPEEFKLWFKAMFDSMRDELEIEQDSPLTGNAPETMSLAFSSEYAGDSENIADPTLEKPTVTPEEIVAAFLALPPEQQAVVLPQLAASGAGPTPATVPPEQMAEVPAPNVPTPAPVPGATMSDDKDPDKMFASMCKKFADDPKADPAAKEIFSAFSAKFSDMTKRFGDLEAAQTAKQKDGEAASMSAFSAEWDTTFKANDGDRKIAPNKREALKKLDLDLAATKAFSTTDTRQQLIGGLATRLKGLDVDPRLQIQPAVGSDGKPVPKAPIQPTETLNILTGPGSFLAGQVNAKAIRERMGIAG